jgi:hypothetical protein
MPPNARQSLLQISPRGTSFGIQHAAIGWIEQSSRQPASAWLFFESDPPYCITFSADSP